MKSILYQLEKYRPKQNDQIKLAIPELLKQEQEDALWQLACKIVNPQYSDRDIIWKSAVKRVASRLVDMPESPFGDILFSREILGIYHCYYRHQIQVASEEHTDAFFMAFLRQIDPVEYQKRFEKSVDETVKKLAVIRIALATSEENNIDIVHGYNYTNSCGCSTIYSHRKKIDKLPPEFKQPALEYLGVSTIAAVAGLQEKLTRYATLDQIILGRMGYIMFWSWSNRGEKSNMPLLSSPQKALSAPRIICLPAPEDSNEKTCR